MSYHIMSYHYSFLSVESRNKLLCIYKLPGRKVDDTIWSTPNLSDQAGKKTKTQYARVNDARSHTFRSIKVGIADSSNSGCNFPNSQNGKCRTVAFFFKVSNHTAGKIRCNFR